MLKQGFVVDPNRRAGGACTEPGAGDRDSLVNIPRAQLTVTGTLSPTLSDAVPWRSGRGGESGPQGGEGGMGPIW